MTYQVLKVRLVVMVSVEFGWIRQRRHLPAWTLQSHDNQTFNLQIWNWFWFEKVFPPLSVMQKDPSIHAWNIISSSIVIFKTFWLEANKSKIKILRFLTFKCTHYKNVAIHRPIVPVLRIHQKWLSHKQCTPML